MIYALVYLIISALYGYYVFARNPSKNNVKVITQLALGTTWALYFVIYMLVYVYRLFDVNIYYLVTVNKEKKDD